ncbi:MAG: ABC transporter ATP-binding protein [Desulfobacterium sp.]|jgi:NitT/TauT family transport system ATP-binding protein|nr:ABC transporter ATP-binding protein [Desulfobacterium sp.]
MLKVIGAAKSFGNRTIFSNFTLKVEPGEFKVLVGPSGCGKSTLFDGLTGVVGLDRGKITWKGKDLTHLRGHAAYMQQKDLLLPWFTLMENSLLPAITGGKKQDRTLAGQRAGRLFHSMGLQGFENHYPAQVSGGMRQRCALVRTLMFERELILLDEPLSALDAITRGELHSLLLLLQSEFNQTILMITHDIEEALILGDTICLLSSCPMDVIEEFTPKSPKPRAFETPELLDIRVRVLERLRTLNSLDLICDPKDPKMADNRGMKINGI